MSYSISTTLSDSTNSTSKKIFLVPSNKWFDCFSAKGINNILKVNLGDYFYLEIDDDLWLSGIYYLSKTGEKIELNKKMADQDTKKMI